MLEKLKSSLTNYFSNGPKTIFIVMLFLLCITVTIFDMKKTVAIVIDGKEEKKVITLRDNTKNILKAENIVMGPKDKVIPGLDSKVKDGDRIYIKKAVEVQIAVDGKDLKLQSAEDSVEAMLQAEGIKLGEVDRVSPSKEEKLKDGLKVAVTRVDSKIVKETQPIDFATVVKKDDEMEKNVTKILQDGVAGEKVISTRVVVENGKEISRQVVSETITKQPVDKIMSVGTLGVFTASRGGKVYYTKSLRARATAYTADYDSTGKGPGDSGFGITASGTTAKRNSSGYSSIAVDPRIIPLGTKLYVEGYGYAIAEDTGGAIKGNSIDVFFDSASEVYNWGVRSVNVYIVK